MSDSGDPLHVSDEDTAPQSAENANKLNENEETQGAEISRKRKLPDYKNSEDDTLSPSQKRAKLALEAASRLISIPLRDVAFDPREEVQKYFQNAISKKKKLRFGMDQRFLALQGSTGERDPTVKVSTMKLKQLHDQLDYYKKKCKQLQDMVNYTAKHCTDSDLEEKTTTEKLAMLSDIPRPTIQRGIDFESSKGFRLLDLQTFRVALSKAQDCQCAKLGEFSVLCLSSFITLQL